MLDRQDPDIHDAEDVDGKLDKADPRANYRFAVDVGKSCRYCVHFEPDDDAQPWRGGGCEIVAGSIRAIDTCNRFESIRRRESKRKKQEDSAGTDHQFPTPVDAWSTSEGEHAEGACCRAAEAALDAFEAGGWQTTKGLRWTHPKLKGHEIEIADRNWTHSVDDIVMYAGPHHQLAKHVKHTTTLFKTMEAARDFQRRLDLQD